MCPAEQGKSRDSLFISVANLDAKLSPVSYINVSVRVLSDMAFHLYQCHETASEASHHVTGLNLCACWRANNHCVVYYERNKCTANLT